MPRKCYRCNGEGTIEKNFPATETHLEFDAPVKCPECEGSGVCTVLGIESSGLDTELEAWMLHRILELAKEAGYTEVHDNWGAGAYDTYTIDEAIEKFKPKHNDVVFCKLCDGHTGPGLHHGCDNSHRPGCAWHVQAKSDPAI